MRAPFLTARDRQHCGRRTNGCLHLDQHFTGVRLRAGNLAYIEDVDAAVAIESHRFHELSVLIYVFGSWKLGLIGT